MSEDANLQHMASAIMGLDRLIHEPSRLVLLTILCHTGGANYLHVRELTGLSKGNLSNHLAKLEKAGLVDIGKHFEGKKPVTTLRLTEKGRETIEAYWKEMKETARKSRDISDADPARVTLAAAILQPRGGCSTKKTRSWPPPGSRNVPRSR